jgi:hypothetical protein
MILENKHMRYDKKRLSRPRISALTNVNSETIEQLQWLADHVDGSKKKAIIESIKERYLKHYNDD